MRRELDKLIRNIRTDDTIGLDSVSRMSRNAEDGFSIYQELYHNGVDLAFLNEPQINTDTYRRTLQEKSITLPLHSGDEATDRLMQAINASSFIPDGQVKPVRLHVSNNTYYNITNTKQIVYTL